MKIHFVKVNPVENMTIFVLDQFPRESHIDISNTLMDYSNVHAEQVGFIEFSKDKSTLRLQMMGGEFCGNATRSLAALMVHNNYPQIQKQDDEYIVHLEASGIAKSIVCIVKILQNPNKYLSKIEMPLPLNVQEIKVNYDEILLKTLKVDLPGITHFIIDKDEIDDKDKFYEIVKRYMADEEYDAFGIMYYDFKENFLEPLVYVKATDSLFWERSCASGTCALGCALSFLEGESIDMDVSQPGGKLKVSVDYKDGNINKLYLDGEVEIVSEGVAYV